MHVISLWLNQMHVSVYSFFMCLIELHSLRIVPFEHNIWVECYIGHIAVFFDVFECEGESKKANWLVQHICTCAVSTQPHMALIHKYVMCGAVCVCTRNDDAICCCNDVSHCVHLALSHNICVCLKISNFTLSDSTWFSCKMHMHMPIAIIVYYIFTLYREMYGQLIVLTLAYMCFFVCVWGYCCCVLGK